MGGPEAVAPAGGGATSGQFLGDIQSDGVVRVKAAKTLGDCDAVESGGHQGIDGRIGQAAQLLSLGGAFLEDWD